MKPRLLLFLLPCCLGLPGSAWAQSPDSLLSQAPNPHTEKAQHPYRLGPLWKKQKLAGLLFWFYKNSFSRQDANDCAFHVSCSAYGQRALAQKGLVIGTFATFDRLSRCHQFSRQHYQRHPQSGRLLDPRTPPEP